MSPTTWHGLNKAELSRRRLLHLLFAAGTAGVAGPALAACDVDEDDGREPPEGIAAPEDADAWPDPDEVQREPVEPEEIIEEDAIEEDEGLEE